MQHSELSEKFTYLTAAELTVTRLQPCIGACISGVDWCRPSAPAVAREIKQALLAHGVISFHGQPLDFASHKALAELFGEALDEGRGPVGREAQMVLRSKPAKAHSASGIWHSDGTFHQVCPSVTVRHMDQSAWLGGDTCFASAVAACAGLPENVKYRIALLETDPSIAYSLYRAGGLARTPDAPGPPLQAVPARHPVVRVHPDTDAPVLFVNEAHTIGVVAMDEAESRELLRYLTDQFRRPEYQVRWKWTDHDVAVWDNRAVQHYAVPDAAGYRRLERIVAAGTASIGLAA